MVAYMLVRKSNIALLHDYPFNVIELAAAARKVPGPVSPKLVALASQQEARGWALLGEADHFGANIDTAAELLRRHPEDVDQTAPVYLHHYDLDTLEEQSASGYRACGQAETAVAILERKIAETPEHLHRDQGHQLAKLANTVLATAQPDPERAAALGLGCLSAAQATGSARIAKELRTLDAALCSRWASLPATGCDDFTARIWPDPERLDDLLDVARSCTLRPLTPEQAHQAKLTIVGAQPTTATTVPWCRGPARSAPPRCRDPGTDGGCTYPR